MLSECDVWISMVEDTTAGCSECSGQVLGELHNSYKQQLYTQCYKIDLTILLPAPNLFCHSQFSCVTSVLKVYSLFTLAILYMYFA